MSLNLSPTLISKIIIKQRRKSNLEVFNFGLGENKLSQPKKFIEYIKKHSDKKNYIPVSGIPELNKTIQKYNSNLYYKVDKVLFGNGLKELLFIVQLAFEGKIFHITPSWVSYDEQIKILKKQKDLIQIHSSFNNNYKITAKELDIEMKKYSGKKLIIFNNPNNPTGIMYNKEEIVSLGHIFQKHNCIVFADEIYKNINHFNEFYSISNIIPHLTIRGNSVSKDIACGGYRLGWITFPKKLINLYNKCQSISSSIYSCTCAPIQYALNDLLNDKESLDSYLHQTNNIYSKVTKLVIEMLNSSKLKFVIPNSSWYIYLNFKNYQKKLKNKYDVNNSVDLFNVLINEIGFVSVAGIYFGRSELCIRISLIDVEVSQSGVIKENIELSCKNIILGINKLLDFLKDL